MCYFVSIKFKLYFMLQEIHQKNIQILQGNVEHRIQFWRGFVSYIPVAKLGGGCDSLKLLYMSLNYFLNMHYL